MQSTSGMQVIQLYRVYTQYVQYASCKELVSAFIISVKISSNVFASSRRAKVLIIKKAMRLDGEFHAACYITFSSMKSYRATTT